MKKLSGIFCVSSIILIFSVLFIFPSIHTFSLTLNVKDDSIFTKNWKFSHDRTYHYFNHTNEIPNSFLPVLVSALPEGDGTWVLRHKDFMGEPRSQPSENEDTTKSVISISSFLLFNSVTVKALAFGDAELDVVFDNGGWENGLKTKNEKISLLEYNKNCTMSEPNTSEEEKGLKWIVYEIQTEKLTGHMSLEAKIPHSKSFIILDEILIHIGDEDNNSEETIVPEANMVDVGHSSKLGCKIIE